MQPNIAVGHLGSGFRVTRPHNVVDRIDILQKLRNPLQPIRNLTRNGLEIHAAALLEVGELRDLLPIQHHLPADTPGTAYRPLPVVLFELDVMLTEVDANGDQRFEVELLHALRRRLEDDLQLRVTEEAVGVLAVTAVRGPARRLRVGNADGLGPQHAKEGVG